MKLLNDLFRLCGQIMSSMFDSNNPETAVEQFLKSTEKTPEIFEGVKASETLTPLSDVPNLDYYEESKESKEKEKEQEETEHIQEKDTCKNSIIEPILDDSSNKRLMYELPNLLEELNRLRSQTTDENVISTINFCENRIEEMMLSCGCKLIDEDVSFDNSRHVPNPFSFIPDGCTIERIIRPGLSYENKVLVKAIVKCKQQES